MKHFNFKIIDVKHIKADDMGRVSIWCHRLNKLITLPYPEFSSDCIVLLTNPIDIYVSSGYETIGKYSMQENSRTTCFIYPYSVDKFEYWERIYKEMDDWNPFFPEKKEKIYVENDISVHFYKAISFNKNWQPITHKFYVERQWEENPDNYYKEIDRYEEIDVEDYDCNDREEKKWEIDITNEDESENFNITDEGVEYNDTTSGYDVYAIEYFGDIEENKCQDECWACYRILEKEWLYLIEVSTQKDGYHFNDYTREVLGDSVDDALGQMFDYIACTEERELCRSDIISYSVYHDDKWIIRDGLPIDDEENIFGDEVINNICTNVCYFATDGYECIEKLRGKYNKECAEMIYCYILGENYAVANSNAIKAVDSFTHESHLSYYKGNLPFIKAKYLLAGLFVNDVFRVECGDESFEKKINSQGIDLDEMTTFFCDEFYSPDEAYHQRETRLKHYILCFLAGIRHVFADKLNEASRDDDKDDDF